MIMSFYHGDKLLHEAEVAPVSETRLPKVVMVGAALFVFDQMAWQLPEARWVALYQATSPMMVPPAAEVIDHFAPEPSDLPDLHDFLKGTKS